MRDVVVGKPIPGAEVERVEIGVVILRALIGGAGESILEVDGERLREAVLELDVEGVVVRGGVVDEPAYYSYTVPKPAGLEREPVRPAAASWNAQLSEFILRYDDVRRADSPDQALYDFLASTYEAGARLGKWDRAVLEA